MVAMDYVTLAQRVLEGGHLTREEALRLLAAPEDDLLLLLHGAFLLRRAFFGRGVQIHVIENARSGLCSEDCAYCSQSAVSTAQVPRYDLKSVEAIVEGARQARRLGAVRYCIVTSGRELQDDDVTRVCEAVRRIKAELDISICTSLGALDEARARALRAAGVNRYNHNLETSKRFFPSVCTTHTYEERLGSACAAKAAGLELCSGVLLGMGETFEDRVDVAFALREIGADAIPVNFLDPRPGTPLAERPPLSPTEALRALAMFRYVNPRAELRLAGGRERILGPMQALGLYAANSFFTGGYLTTGGQGYESDMALLRAAGFHVAGIVS